MQVDWHGLTLHVTPMPDSRQPMRRLSCAGETHSLVRVSRIASPQGIGHVRLHPTASIRAARRMEHA